MSANHVTPRQLGGASQSALAYRIAPLTHDDRAYARSTWQFSYKESSRALLQTPWPLYKATIGAQLDSLLSTAELLGAFSEHDNRIIGWIAHTPGSRVDTLHWVYTRYQLDDGTPCRRRGVMRALVEAAELGQRLAYTHRGPRPVKHRGKKDRSPQAARHVPHGETSDVALADWLRRGGRSVAFVPYEEWSR